ncbi:hypothetical protein L1987_22896 [Smallanthus sonchifolius]|uniref:Uncharacterized protein n=1 Tax=Smallanthus sonchifolius TaxID=185202 RepID=A0ACB9IGQ1_9ASTR|nr:hypothetical protein L1987_22896 [Smallanthus sonchifolius]
MAFSLAATTFISGNPPSINTRLCLPLTLPIHSNPRNTLSITRGVLAASGYARASGVTGVCIATSGPGAINILNGLADALIDSVPIVAITGQVPLNVLGNDTFQDAPVIELTHPITKHNYLVLNIRDIPRIVREAFYVASSGRPGQVLIDIPKDIQQQLVVPKWDEPMSLAELTGIPVANTLMGLGTYPGSHDLSLQMLGMHGTVYANYAVDESDLLLAFGVRFDDRVTGKIEAFASRARIVHIDIDPAEIGKNKQPHLSICGDIKTALQGINKILERGENMNLDFSPWKQELVDQKASNPLSFETFGDAIPPQYAIQVLDELTGGNAIITTGVGQHQMWSAQFYKYSKPRQWLTSGGLGVMGFGLPAVARPDAVVCAVVLRKPEKRIRDIPRHGEACDIPAARVTKKGDVRTAIQKMLDTPLLDVIFSHEEHILPMIPPGGGFKDIITEGDGRRQY